MRLSFFRLPELAGNEPVPSASSCRWLLVSDRESNPHDIGRIAHGNSPARAADDEQWRLMWQGQRRVNRGERLFLYARVAAMK